MHCRLYSAHTRPENSHREIHNGYNASYYGPQGVPALRMCPGPWRSFRYDAISLLPSELSGAALKRPRRITRPPACDLTVIAVVELSQKTWRVGISQSGEEREQVVNRIRWHCERPSARLAVSRAASCYT
jgi:hypothetical protein